MSSSSDEAAKVSRDAEPPERGAPSCNRAAGTEGWSDPPAVTPRKPLSKWWLVAALLTAGSVAVPVSCSGTDKNGTWVFSFGSVSVDQREDDQGNRRTKIRTGAAVFRPD